MIKRQKYISPESNDYLQLMNIQNGACTTIPSSNRNAEGRLTSDIIQQQFTISLLLTDIIRFTSYDRQYSHT